MTGTVEATNNNITIKLNALIELFNLFSNLNTCVDTKLLNEINEIKEDYEMGSINILSNYYLTIHNIKMLDKDDDDEKNKLIKIRDMHFNNYHGFIYNENIISKMDRIVKHLKNYITDGNSEHTPEIYDLLKTFNKSTIVKSNKEFTYEICVCNNKMDIDPVYSALVCKQCGLVKKLFGTVFEDDQFYFQDGHRIKHGTYDPSKHCRFWVDRIQGHESTEIPDSVINKIKKCIMLDKIIHKHNINCNHIRKYLHQTNNSKYNEHVPLIRKLITNISPPQLTDYEIQLINIYFDKVIHIFDDIKPDTKTNCPYHPYFIYKIIEQIITANHDRIRKLKILSCIHLQSRETLICNDTIWAPICVRIPEFVYIPTDRNGQYHDF